MLRTTHACANPIAKGALSNAVPPCPLILMVWEDAEFTAETGLVITNALAAISITHICKAGLSRRLEVGRMFLHQGAKDMESSMALILLGGPAQIRTGVYGSQSHKYSQTNPRALSMGRRLRL